MKAPGVTALGCLLIILCIGIGGWAFVTTFSTRETKPTSQTKINEESKYDTTMIEKNMAILRKMKLLVRVEPEWNRAFVDPVRWSALNIDRRENIAATLALYCGWKGGGIDAVNIKSHQTGKVLAKYTVGWGYEPGD